MTSIRIVGGPAGGTHFRADISQSDRFRIANPPEDLRICKCGNPINDPELGLQTTEYRIHTMELSPRVTEYYATPATSGPCSAEVREGEMVFIMRRLWDGYRRTGDRT